MAKQDILQDVTDQIIAAIEGGILEDGKWERPWNVSNVFPMNPVTGKGYNGMNAILLMMFFGGGHFAGYGQWQQKAAQVRKGEKAIPILAPMMRKTGRVLPNGKDEMAPIGFRTVKVFQSTQVDGYEMPVIEPNLAFVEHKAAEDAIQAMIAKGMDYRHGGDRAYYAGSGEGYVQMPTKEQFPVEADYYATSLHELVHWTMHSSRLDRKKAVGDKYGRNSYAFEELVAELGAAILCGELGVHNGYRDDHAKYIAGWLDIMKGDKKAIFEAAKHAGKAVDVIMGRRTLKGEIITQQEDTKVAA